MLTNVQAEVIYILRREFGLEVGEPFALEDVFPVDENCRVLRRAVLRLRERGLLEQPEAYKWVFALSLKTLDAYDAWAMRRPEVREVLA